MGPTSSKQSTTLIYPVRHDGFQENPYEPIRDLWEEDEGDGDENIEERVVTVSEVLSSFIQNVNRNRA